MRRIFLVSLRDVGWSDTQAGGISQSNIRIDFSGSENTLVSIQSSSRFVCVICTVKNKKRGLRLERLRRFSLGKTNSTGGPFPYFLGERLTLDLRGHFLYIIYSILVYTLVCTMNRISKLES